MSDARALRPVLLMALLAAAACSADRPANPSFQLTLADADAALVQMRAQPMHLHRPLVVIGGIYDPGWGIADLAAQLRSLVSTDTPVLAVGSLGSGTMALWRDGVIDRIETACPSDRPGWTVDVDVVAFSMGGLVARYAAMPRSDGADRLRIHNLFTISTPHRGARLADWPTLDDRVVDMRAGSAFLADLDTALPECTYDLFSYVRLGDVIVGQVNAAPAPSSAWWVPNIPLQMSHRDAYRDPRILADIARRLRSEPPFSTSPPAPLPGGRG